MTEDKFEEFLKKTAQGYNAPPARAPREEMWSAIQAKRAAGPQVVYGGGSRSSRAPARTIRLEGVARRGGGGDAVRRDRRRHRSLDRAFRARPTRSSLPSPRRRGRAPTRDSSDRRWCSDPPAKRSRSCGDAGRNAAPIAVATTGSENPARDHRVSRGHRQQRRDRLRHHSTSHFGISARDDPAPE